MGGFAINVAVAHAIGSSRGERSQLSAAGLSLTDFLVPFGRTINELLLAQRDALCSRADLAAQADPRQIHSAFLLVRDTTEPKNRWVDGTPEYSLYLPALRKMFPEARFVHIVRDVRSVVKSMLKFRDALGTELVKNEQEAYDYWLRTVRACLDAEKAWGSRGVLRIRHADLLQEPRETFERVFDFVSEPFSSKCLEPLQARINSSLVPPDFDPSDPATDPALRDRAERLSAELMQQARVDMPADTDAGAAMEAAFAERVQFALTLDGEYVSSQKTIEQLNQEINESSAWALSLDQKLIAKNSRIVELQKELDDRTTWALKLDQDSAVKDSRIAELQRELEQLANWAQKLYRESVTKDRRITLLQEQLELPAVPPSAPPVGSASRDDDPQNIAGSAAKR